MKTELQSTKILIAHDGKKDIEIAKSIVRLISDELRVLPKIKSYDNFLLAGSKKELIADYECDILVILSLADTYNGSGIQFLRNYWAELILGGTSKDVSSTLIISQIDKDKLRKKDPRYDISYADGIEFVMLGNDLITKIQVAMKVHPTIDDIKTCLVKSCDANRKQLEHDLRNYDGPYSLLVGAYYAGEFEGRSGLDDALIKLYERQMHEELKICHAASYIDVFQSLEEEGHSSQLRLCDKLAGRKILLIDDESETAGWELALKAIFGDRVDLDAYKGRNWTKSKYLVDDIIKRYALTDASTMMPYDLILMDLYLSDQDKEKKKDDAFTEFASKTIINKIRKTKKDDIPIILFTASKHAERIDALKETLGDIIYFPKKAFYDKKESKKYFTKYKIIFDQMLSQERLALRDILGYIKNYQVTSKHPNNDAITTLLLDAHSKLKAFFSGGEIKSVLMDLASALEKHYDLRSVKNSFLTTYNHPDHTSIDKYRAFICYNMRMSFQTHFDRSPLLEEVLFAFLLCMKVITGNTLHFNYHDLCPAFNLNNQTIEMLNSICQPCTLPYRKECKDKKIGYPCRGKAAEDILTRAMLLSLHDNLYAREARNNRPLFLYLYYILNLNKTFGVEIDILEDILIKYAVMKRNSLFCPPYDSNGWNGNIQVDHIVGSPLGKLPAEMVKIARDRFELTERFRIG